MTEVIQYNCKSCGKSYGPLGMHGFLPDTGEGELPIVCKKCKEILVGRFENGKLKTDCPTCKSKPINFDSKCPNCGSNELYYKDLRLGVEQKCGQ